MFPMTIDRPAPGLDPWSASKTRWLREDADGGPRQSARPDDPAKPEPESPDPRRSEQVGWPRIFPSL